MRFYDDMKSDVSVNQCIDVEASSDDGTEDEPERSDPPAIPDEVFALIDVYQGQYLLDANALTEMSNMWNEIIARAETNGVEPVMQVGKTGIILEIEIWELEIGSILGKIAGSWIFCAH